MIPADTREMVLLRDGYRCLRCGTGVYGRQYSIHHRLLRSQGGDDTPANLVTLCGTGTTGCHHEVHSRRADRGIPGGWIVPSRGDPEQIPVVTKGGTVLLTNGGTVLPYAP